MWCGLRCRSWRASARLGPPPCHTAFSHASFLPILKCVDYSIHVGAGKRNLQFHHFFIGNRRPPSGGRRFPALSQQIPIPRQHSVNQNLNAGGQIVCLVQIDLLHLPIQPHQHPAAAQGKESLIAPALVKARPVIEQGELDRKSVV